MFDYAKRIEEVNAHTTSDLENFYDQKKPELCRLVEQTIGVNRSAIKLITNVLPRLENCAGTVNGVSKEKHRGRNNVLGGTGKGNISQE